MTPNDTPGALRAELVRLRAATLQAQAARMGLKKPDEEISAAARAKIQTDVDALPDGALAEQVAHWTELLRRATNALATKPEGQ